MLARETCPAQFPSDSGVKGDGGMDEVATAGGMSMEQEVKAHLDIQALNQLYTHLLGD